MFSKIAGCLIGANMIVNLFTHNTNIHYWIVSIVGLIGIICLAVYSSLISSVLQYFIKDYTKEDFVALMNEIVRNR